MKESFRIVIMGDSSSSVSEINSDILRNHLTHIKELSPQPQFIFFIGDMVYGGTNVNQQLEKWRTLVEEYYPINMVYTAIGNHDKNEEAFSSVFTHLPDEQLKGYKRTVYYFDYQNTRFIVLNSNRSDSNGGYVIRKEQQEWLEKVLSTSNKKHNFVMFHVPAFPTGHHYGESLDRNSNERNALWKIISKYNVTSVFVGHEHNYCRRVIDSSFNVSESLSIKNPIYHVITGGAGTSINAKIADRKNAVIGPIASYHYTVVDIYDKEVILQAFDRENNIIDSCTLFPYSSYDVSRLKEDILIPLNSEWKYFDMGIDQEEAWRKESFDDSLWNSGYAELGYGDGGEATVVSYGPNIHKKYITTYFRKDFFVSSPSKYKELTISIQRDDGAVVYLNGIEIFRTNMPSGIISFDTLASKAIDGIEEISYEKMSIDAKLLRKGKNVIAVEIHQASASSSDISFNFQLLGHMK